MNAQSLVKFGKSGGKIRRTFKSFGVGSSPSTLLSRLNEATKITLAPASHTSAKFNENGGFRVEGAQPPRHHEFDFV
jgi:hypothetical protein